MCVCLCVCAYMCNACACLCIFQCVCVCVCDTVVGWFVIVEKLRLEAQLTETSRVYSVWNPPDIPTVNGRAVSPTFQIQITFISNIVQVLLLRKLNDILFQLSQFIQENKCRLSGDIWIDTLSLFVCIYRDFTQIEWDSVECIPPPVKPNPI